MSKIKKYDYINIGALACTIIGLVIELIGSLVLSRTTAIGFNFNELHPLLFIGFAITVVAIIPAAIGNSIYDTKTNNVISSVALYSAVAVILLGTVVIALTIAGPVLWPVNG